MTQEISLTLEQSSTIENGFVRLDQATMKNCGISSGDLVAIKKKTTTYAHALPSFLEDRNQNLLRSAPLLCDNIGAEPGDTVTITAVKDKPSLAEQITLEVEDDIDHLHLLTQEEQLISFWQNMPLTQGDWLPIPTLGKHPLFVRIIDTKPNNVVKIGHDTRFSIIEAKERKKEAIPLGGLREIMRSCQDIIRTRMKKTAPISAKSIIFSGSVGSGKKKLALKLAQEENLIATIFDAAKLLDKDLAKEEASEFLSLSDIGRQGKGLIFFDHLEILLTQNNDPLPLLQAKHHVSAQITEMLEEMDHHPNLILVGSWSGAKPKRNIIFDLFDLNILFEAPNRHARHEILITQTRTVNCAEDVNLAEIAMMSSGFSMRDLERLTLSASLLSSHETLTKKDFLYALKGIVPSTQDEVFCEIPTVLWKDIAGLDDVKTLVKETLDWSLNHQEQFSDFGVKPPSFILLSGGQGTGKTSLARALANIFPTYFIEISCPLLISNEIGEARRILKENFALAKRKTPCLIFLDDIDVLFETEKNSTMHHPLVAQLLPELDALALTEGVVLIAATNRPDRLTTEIMRPGRLDYAITLPMPDTAARKRIFQIHARKLPLAADVDFDQMAEQTQSFTPADIANLCNRAGLIALRQSLNSADKGVIPPVVNAALFEQILRTKKN